MRNELEGERYLNSWQKRAIESVEISLTSPLAIFIMGIAALAIKLEDGGHVFYTQERVGKNGDVFKLYKLRTMKASPQEYVFPKLPEDPRVTSVGKIIRPLAIDEFPQLVVNMLIKRNMSLFGIRALAVPQYQELVELHKTHPDIFSEELVEEWKKAYESATPGGLSLAMARGRSSLNLDYDGLSKKMKYDIEYHKKASPVYDLWILKETIMAFFEGKGAW